MCFRPAAISMEKTCPECGATNDFVNEAAGVPRALGRLLPPLRPRARRSRLRLRFGGAFRAGRVTIVERGRCLGPGGGERLQAAYLRA